MHYFDVYHRHLNKFRGRKVNIVEIGIFSGGSLKMWQEYFGDGATVHGVDINPACKAFDDNKRVRVSIGDAGDPKFWREFLAKTPSIDILIDDGNHAHHEQIIAMQEVLPALNNDGVYICEDVAGVANCFCAYACGMAAQLNGPGDEHTNSMQSYIKGISFYPYMVVMEKARTRVANLPAEKHGSEWIPPGGFALGA